MNQNIRITIILSITLILVSSISIGLLLQNSQSKIIFKVFTAGSLSEPFDHMESGEDMETIFEKEHPDVDVQISSGGSAAMIRWITDFNQICDVLAIADYRLIEIMMINSTMKSASFALQFAKNSIVLAYTDKSRYSDEINSTNWIKILRRSDVKFGFSNPNDDPCGYRSQMTLILAEQYYGDTMLYENLVMSNTNIKNIITAGGITSISIPSVLTVTNSEKLMIRSAEVELTSALESGAIDYLFIYESVAKRHARSGEKYIELPRQINLNDTSYSWLYETVRVIQFADSVDTSKIKTVIGEPIVYGLTIPTGAAHPDIAVEFLKFVLSERGQQVMRNAGQEPISPAIAGYWIESVPEDLKELVM